MINPIECLLPMIDLVPDDFPNFQRAWCLDNSNSDNSDDSDDEEIHNVICVETRSGGEYRKEFIKDIDKLLNNKFFIKEIESKYDNTYLTFYFGIPNEFLDDFSKFMDDGGNPGEYDYAKLSNNYLDKLETFLPDHYKYITSCINNAKQNKTTNNEHKYSRNVNIIMIHLLIIAFAFSFAEIYLLFCRLVN